MHLQLNFSSLSMRCVFACWPTGNHRKGCFSLLPLHSSFHCFRFKEDTILSHLEFIVSNEITFFLQIDIQLWVILENGHKRVLHSSHISNYIFLACDFFGWFHKRHFLLNSSELRIYQIFPYISKPPEQKCLRFSRWYVCGNYAFNT